MVPVSTKPSFRTCALCAVLALASVAASAGTLLYEYDALGRLVEVQHPDSQVVRYVLDPAGNRTEVAATTLPGMPASISVPASSATGSYTVGWGAAGGTVTAYQLYEATDAGFAGQTLAYSGSALSKAISGKGNGSYYYRVRACNGSLCDDYLAGANPTVVTLAVPAPPASVTGPWQNSTGNYTISWASSAGATRYELWENLFGGPFSKVYDGANTSKGFSGKPNGEYRYKAKACNAAGCSGYSPVKLVVVCISGCAFAAPPPEE